MEIEGIVSKYDELYTKYPKIFGCKKVDKRYPFPMFGFEIGEGWFDLIDRACTLVQGHIDSSRKNRASAIRYNRALKRALKNNDLTGLEWYFSFGRDKDNWAKTQAALAVASAKYRVVPEAVTQLVATQIKEKWGMLSFYYANGDEYCDGVIRMAEYMSGCICEICGKPGKSNNNGWIKVKCPDCLKKNEELEYE